MARSGSGLWRGDAAQSPERGGALGPREAPDPGRRRDCASRPSGNSSPGEDLDSPRSTSPRGSGRLLRDPGHISGAYALRPSRIRRAQATRISMGGGGPAESASARGSRAGLPTRLWTQGSEADSPPARRSAGSANNPFAAGGCLRHLLPHAPPADALVQHDGSRLRDRRPLAKAASRRRARQLGIPPPPRRLRERSSPRHRPPSSRLPNHPHNPPPHPRGPHNPRQPASSATAAERFAVPTWAREPIRVGVKRLALFRQFNLGRLKPLTEKVKRNPYPDWLSESKNREALRPQSAPSRSGFRRPARPLLRARPSLPGRCRRSRR
jgi:hypothetical protein